MKTNIIRAAVFTLVFAGFSSSTIASMRTTSPMVKVAAKGGPTSLPTPVCSPNDPKHCGAD